MARDKKCPQTPKSPRAWGGEVINYRNQLSVVHSERFKSKLQYSECELQSSVKD